MQWRNTIILILLLTTISFAQRYAVVVSDVTNNTSGWDEVVDSLMQRHNGVVFTWQDSVGEVKDALSAYRPDYVAFVARAVIDLDSYFVDRIWDLLRDLDGDAYGDAIWGIVTGYDDGDAMRIVQNQSLQMKTVLGGTNCIWDSWCYQSISTFEGQYNRIRFKIPDTSLIIDTICPPRCPDDRCTLLVNYLNNGCNDTILGYGVQGPVDYFITSGHGNTDTWQLHYPTPDLEGFFKSFAGQLYGDPHTGADRNINSSNAKVYNAMGNCLIGNPNGMNNMPYAWLHTGGAIAMTGYMPTTVYGYMLWGLGSLLQMAQDRYTYAEAFFINNQELIFDRINGTPGTDSVGLDYDRNACCYYGDPAADIRLYAWRDPWWDQGVELYPGSDRDTIMFWIEANYDSVDPGFSGTSGRRHPFAFLPNRYDSIEVIDMNCYDAVITDNFVLMYCWTQGDQRLANGEMKWVTFTGKQQTGIKESSVITVRRSCILSISPTVVQHSLHIRFTVPADQHVSIRIYDVTGRLVVCCCESTYSAGTYDYTWDVPGSHPSNGIYFVQLQSDNGSSTEKFLIIR
jgi:zinc protease